MEQVYTWVMFISNGRLLLFDASGVIPKQST